ncbi:MAG: peptidoglycan-binding domain-containing protein [Bacteroidota bacterium]
MRLLTLTLVVALATVFPMFGQAPEGLPADAEAGKCYAKCMIADDYETVTERVVVKAASKRVEIVPAKFETITQRILIKEPSKRIASASLSNDLYENATERVMIKPAYVRYEYVPAEYETITERIMVREASKRFVPRSAKFKTVRTQVETEPEVKYAVGTVAQFETVTERVMVREASTRLERVDPVYEKQMERVMVTPATTKWVQKKADPNCLSADPNDCLVWCLVEVPATYKSVATSVASGCPVGYESKDGDCVRTIEVPAEYTTIRKQVVKNDATANERTKSAKYQTVVTEELSAEAGYEEIEIPAEYETVRVRKVKTEARINKIEVPAEYRNVSTKKLRATATASLAGDASSIDGEYRDIQVQKMVTPATTRVVDVPAKYEEVTTRKLVKKGGFEEWREILCAEQVTSYTIRQIQDALKARGYDPGPLDNLLGTQTKAALVKFQKDNKLPIGNLNLETLKALGVQY